MRYLLSVAVTVLCVLCCGTAHSQSVSLHHVDGALDSTHLNTGVPVTFHIRITGDACAHAGFNPTGGIDSN